MYVMIIIFLCISHLSITASEQEQPQTPISPPELDTPRPETPSYEHTVTVHKRQSSLRSLAALSITSATQSRSSISSLEPSSPQSPVELSSTAPLAVRTESPKHATPIRVSPKSEQADPNRRLFPAMYLTNFQGKIPVTDIDDDDSLSCGFCCLCATCVVGTLAGVVIAIVAVATHGNPFN